MKIIWSQSFRLMVYQGNKVYKMKLKLTKFKHVERILISMFFACACTCTVDSCIANISFFINVARRGNLKERKDE